MDRVHAGPKERRYMPAALIALGEVYVPPNATPRELQVTLRPTEEAGISKCSLPGAVSRLDFSPLRDVGENEYLRLAASFSAALVRR